VQVEVTGSLLTHLGCTEAHFNVFITEMRVYRDKFVAHLASRKANGYSGDGYEGVSALSPTLSS
jgi:hypothetical protein